MTAPIDLYYWPTPNGWKITIALEEMGLPYHVHLVNIGAGDQFKPDFLKIAPNNRMPAIIDPEGPDGAPISRLRIGRDPAIPGAQDGPVLWAPRRTRGWPSNNG
jgi:GSH-dependent disulfide-bond oxidoreductase